MRANPRVTFFGTFDERRHPRVTVLREGLEARRVDVTVLNVPVDLDTAARVQLAEQPWRAPLVAGRIGLAWARLLARSVASPRPDVVVVGYLGHLDVHLARARWRRSHLVVDHMISLADTVRDRGIDRSTGLLRFLEAADRAATGRADTVLVDTAAHAATLPTEDRHKALVVAVGAPAAWYAAGDTARATRSAERSGAAPLTVAFFGLYTPLQGAPVIGEAIARLAGRDVRWTMVGVGQDRPATEQAAAGSPHVRWLDWVDADDLPDLVAAHDVCLGIFDTGAKAARVVPNKVFQGLAAGCAVVTSATQVQVDALRDAALFVPPGDARALADAIGGLADDRAALDDLRARARAGAERFRPSAVVEDLAAVVAAAPHETTTPGGPMTTDAAPALPPLTPQAALRWHLVARHLDAVAPASVLELGCGQGAAGARLAARAAYVGVEPDGSSRATARRRMPPGARLLASADELGADESFDLLCAFEVLEHIDDDHGALASWVSHLRPGGHCLVSVPAGPERFGAADELVGHLRRYAAADLGKLFESAGLEVVALDHYGFPLGYALEAGRNAIARRRLARPDVPDDAAERSAGSGRLLQPPAWSSALLWWSSAPFRAVQDRRPDRGPGLVGLARRPV